MQTPIVLIGPMSAGKSTIGAILADELGLPTYALDDARWDYYNEVGYDDERAAAIVAAEGMTGLIRYWKPFEVHAVERALAEHDDGVIDFGAGHSVHDDDALSDRVRRALAPLANVILILPDPDPEISIAVLNDRFSRLLQAEIGTVDPDLLRLNAHFVRHPANAELAKIVVYTENKSPAQVCAEIRDRLQ